MKTKLNIKDKIRINKTTIGIIFVVSSKTRNGLCIQNRKLVKKLIENIKLLLNNFIISDFINFFSIKWHKYGNIINPRGKIKYGGNSSDVKKPIVNIVSIFNYSF